jgi:hypothetical protein
MRLAARLVSITPTSAVPVSRKTTKPAFPDFHPVLGSPAGDLRISTRFNKIAT